MDECALYQDPERYYLDEVAQRPGRVLELACGSGRLTIPIAQSGVDITGIDLSEAMLETARTKARAAGLQVQFLQGDMRRFELARLFDTILIPGNSLLHLLTVEDLRQCLSSVRRHLAPGGRLIFDISQWDLRRLVCYLSAPDAPDFRVIEYCLRVIFPRGLSLLIDTAGFRRARDRPVVLSTVVLTSSWAMPSRR